MSSIFPHAKTHKTLLYKLLDKKIMVVLVNDLYEPNVEHRYLSDVPRQALASKPIELVNKTLKAGVFDAADLFFVNVKNTGNLITTVLIYREGSRKGNSLLVAYIDRANGFPIKPVGGDLTITWDNGFSKIFVLPDEHLEKLGIKSKTI